MSEATILLLSESRGLADQVQEIAKSVPGLGLLTLNGIDAAYNLGSWDGVCLVLIHQSDKGSVKQVDRLLRMISAARRPVATVVLGEPYDDDQALAMLRMGVADYIGLPLDRKHLTHLCEVLTIRQRVLVAPLVEVAEERSTFPAAVEPMGAPVPPLLSPIAARGLILDGETAPVVSLIDQIRRVAPQSATVLLGGETGTGKTHLARQIHELSDRRHEPFLTVSCGTLYGATIEGDLFGHIRGTFDGATTDRAGKLAEVGRGTLFLDGVDALPLPVQAKLLRVVEDRVFEPIGATRSLPMHARLIAASNRPLDEEIAKHRFRSDLFYRLNVVGLHIPPLRERRDAIPTLANRFLTEFATASGRKFDPISGDALKALQDHDWPGNVRELRNVVDRCVAICPDRAIRREDLPASVLTGGERAASVPDLHPVLSATLNQSSLAYSKGQAEYARITEALEKHGNNRLRAAGELGISRMTLYKKLYKYGLMSHSPRLA